MRQFQLTLLLIIALAPALQLLAGQTSSAQGDAASCQYMPGPPDAGTATATGSGVTTAWFGNRTEIYGHGVLGDAIEAHTLYAKSDSMDADDCALQVTLDAQSVYEDVTPRIADVTGDGINDIITIESHRDKGASLSIYSISHGQLYKVSSTPYIGQPYRWLAPVGTADFNADGSDDAVFVQTPHLAGVLQIWSFKGAVAQRLASMPGFSNHRIGENFITGGIAHCDGQPVIIVPDRAWRSTMAATFSDGTIQASAVANSVDSEVIARKLACR